MDIKTFRAATLSDALHLVRHELGPDARVVTTRERPTGFWGRITGTYHVEVQAITTPPPKLQSEYGHAASTGGVGPDLERPSADIDYRSSYRRFALEQTGESLLEDMLQQRSSKIHASFPSTLFRLFTELVDADVDESCAREILEEIQQHSTPAELERLDDVRSRAAEIMTSRIQTTPEIGSHSSRRVVALIGPTGVGKTTTIAKLAANLRLRDKRRVGLITVDTYRIAAVDQLRAFAEIIDLPMEVVTTPREMRNAVASLSDQDLVLIDTAGRSPRDEIQLQELKSMLAEARADEIQLVLSAVSNARHLTRLTDQFQHVAPTSLLLTKLDEAISYGHLLPLLMKNSLPISYTTHGQNVPDDIQAADPARIVEEILADNHA